MELIKLENDIAVLQPDVALKIEELERQAKYIKEKQDLLRERIKNEMEENNILGISMDNLAITYVAPTDKETFDSKRFRSEHPDLYDEYVKFSPVKSFLRVKLK